MKNEKQLDLSSEESGSASSHEPGDREHTSDDEFDNKYIDDNIKKLWTDGDKQELTPIRKWELLQNYQIPNSFKLTNSEVKRIFVLLVPCILFTTVSFSIMIADATLYHFMDIIKDNGKFAISFAGKYMIHIGIF